MSGSLMLWISLALVVFWSVGVYNRLMRMRARGLGALGSVMKHMRVYAELVRGLTAVPLPKEVAEDASEQLFASLQILEQVLNDATASTLMQGSPASLGRAFDTVHHIGRQVAAGTPDATEPVVPTVLRDQLELAAQRVGTAREGFNQLLTKYNQALEQFPASLVVTTMGFKPGDML